MEPDVSIETSRQIRVAILPIGGPIPTSHLREYTSLIARHSRLDLASVASFYTEQQKSPFSQQPWDSGSLSFKFVLGGCSASPWEDFQPCRKVLAVLAICHLPSSSPHLDAVAAHFVDACRPYGSALATRCFAFCPSDAQLAEKKREDIVLLPSADRPAMEHHMLTLLQDLAASLLMEFEKWVLRAESTGTILKTPLDSQSSLGSEEVIKAKKRRLGRAQKTIGDYCLLAGSPADANAHYSTAIELARLTGDVFWHAGALEGSVCALLVDRVGQQDPAMEDEVKYRYYTVIQLYRRAFLQDNAQRVSTVSFELEATLKLARYLCRREHSKEVADLLMGAADGAKSLIDASDRLILFIEIARLFGSLGYRRKAAFFSRQVAQLYSQQESVTAAMSSLQVLTLTTDVYRVQSRKNVKKEQDVSTNLPQSIVALFESHWSTIQMVVLREILMSSIRAGDPLSAWGAGARLLRSFYPLITPAGQSGLASSLSNAADRLPSGTRCADPCLPFIRLHSFPFHPSQTDIIKRNPAKKEWWTGSAPTGPFIYTPFSKSGSNTGSNAAKDQSITWIVGEPVQVLVELANPCSFEIVVESIYLSVHSRNFDAFPVTVTLPPNTSKTVLLSGIPTKPGPVSIPGCIVHCFGVITEHLFKEVDNLLLGAAQGLVLSDPFRSCGSGKVKNVTFPSNINVLPSLPLLVSNLVGGAGANVLYEGEIRDITVNLTNAGSVPVEEVNISVSGRNLDSVIKVDNEKLGTVFPLKPGGEVSFTITLKAWQLGIADTESDARRVSREGSSPYLVIHYAGPLSSNPEESLPPGRRLVVPLNICVVQGLRFVQARLLSMEIPARFAENHTVIENGPDPVKTLVKIDPYKGSWGLRLLELELSNRTDVVFDLTVSIEEDDTAYHKTRIDRDYSARVLIPLEHFKLPVLDEISPKPELNASITALINKIKVRWHSGRNSHGELNVKEAVQLALQGAVLDILLPDPLTFGFRVVKDGDPIRACEVTALETVVRNNTKETIRLSLSVNCKDVAGENCCEGHDATVLWAGVLNNIHLEVPPLKEVAHSFSFYFLVPGDYSLQASAVIIDATEVLHARARTRTPDEPIFCRGSPFHVEVIGTT
ncbi:Trafficking protein particle complex II-specific subunit 120-like protein [Rhynchospora pubera]|uniref:Trafficking protein particle complex II-specific subunit 120-like protein n=1 Tax=Rhynchospora pubera TaxID=906938 RepID=A0AAV8FRJ0_9POAL|nr:Trafficking protein particle complex II-specific subunit 120-like protein [Rhynchospora pubera]